MIKDIWVNLGSGWLPDTFKPSLIWWHQGNLTVWLLRIISVLSSFMGQLHITKLMLYNACVFRLTLCPIRKTQGASNNLKQNVQFKLVVAWILVMGGFKMVSLKTHTYLLSYLLNWDFVPAFVMWGEGERKRVVDLTYSYHSCMGVCAVGVLWKPRKNNVMRTATSLPTTCMFSSLLPGEHENETETFGSLQRNPLSLPFKTSHCSVCKIISPTLQV